MASWTATTLKVACITAPEATDWYSDDDASPYEDSCGSALTDMGRGFSNFSAGIVDHVVLGTVDFLVPDRWARTGRIGPLYSGDNYLPSYRVGTWTGVATDIAVGGRAVVGAWRGITGAVRSAGSVWGAATGAASRAASTARSWADNAVSGVRSLFRRPVPRSVAANEEIAVIGRQWDTAVAKDWAGHEVLDIADWTIAKNDAWVRSVVDRRMKVYIGSPETKANLWDSVAGRSTVFGRELQQFLDAGYVRSGHHLVPPGG